MDDMNQNRNSSSPKDESGYSLNDDRRVKTLSPGRLVARRFFRNRVAVTGLVILVFMFIFSFIGGLLTPYKEDEKFYRTEQKQGIFAAVKENTEQKLVISEDAGFSKVDGTMFEAMAKTAKGSFKVKTASYELVEEGEGFTAIYPEGEDEAIAFVSSYVVSPEKQGETFPSLDKRLFVCGFQFFEVLVGFGLPLFALGFFFLLLKEFVEGLVKDGWRYRL